MSEMVTDNRNPINRPSRAHLTMAANLRRLRQELASINENIFSMLGPLCDAAEARGWGDPSVVEGQAVIATLERERDALRAQLRRIEKVSA